ncbi:hypothetical protein [Phytohabitans houttuyneae]|nr:hypothetical protein [Phytohabitans houttuyneae]
MRSAGPGWRTRPNWSETNASLNPAADGAGRNPRVQAAASVRR